MAGGNGRGGSSHNSPRGGMPPPRGPRGAGGGGHRGGASHPAASHGVDGSDHRGGNHAVGGSDHGGGNREGRGSSDGGRGGGRGRRGGNRVHDNAQSKATHSPQHAAPNTVASSAASSAAKTVPGVANNGNVGESNSTGRLAVSTSTPHPINPANSVAVPSTTATAKPFSRSAILPVADNRETQSNSSSSIRADLHVSQGTPVMAVSNPASTVTYPSAPTTSKALQNPLPSTPSKIFGTFGSNNRASLGTPFTTNNTSSVFRSSTPVPSAPPASANTIPLSAFGYNATIFAAPTFSASVDFRGPQFRESRESSLPPAPVSTYSPGTFGSRTNALTLPPALRHPTSTIPSEAAERTNITPANKPEMQATPTALGKRRVASKSPEPNPTQATEATAHPYKRVKSESQAKISTQGSSTASQLPLLSASISQEVQTWENKLKELDHDFQERDKAWIKRQELEAWREQERKKLVTKREACMKLLQSVRNKMENIIAEEEKLQGEYLGKLEAIEKKGSGNT